MLTKLHIKKLLIPFYWLTLHISNIYLMPSPRGVSEESYVVPRCQGGHRLIFRWFPWALMLSVSSGLLPAVQCCYYSGIGVFVTKSSAVVLFICNSLCLSPFIFSLLHIWHSICILQKPTEPFWFQYQQAITVLKWTMAVAVTTTLWSVLSIKLELLGWCLFVSALS